MNKDLKVLMLPEGATKYLFFGGKGGVGKNDRCHSYGCMVRRSRLQNNYCFYRPHCKPLGNV